MTTWTWIGVTDDFDTQMRRVGIEHPEVVEGFERAHRIVHDQHRGKRGFARSAYRRAISDYRLVFDALLEESQSSPVSG